jgi:hypothetical protein
MEAEDLERKCLELRQRIYHSDHNDIADSMHNLALTLNKKNKFSEAEDLFRKSLEIK